MVHAFIIRIYIYIYIIIHVFIDSEMVDATMSGTHTSTDPVMVDLFTSAAAGGCRGC